MWSARCMKAENDEMKLLLNITWTRSIQRLVVLYEKKELKINNNNYSSLEFCLSSFIVYHLQNAFFEENNNSENFRLTRFCVCNDNNNSKKKKKNDDRHRYLLRYVQCKINLFESLLFIIFALTYNFKGILFRRIQTTNKYIKRGKSNMILRYCKIYRHSEKIFSILPFEEIPTLI